MPSTTVDVHPPASMKLLLKISAGMQGRVLLESASPPIAELQPPAPPLVEPPPSQPQPLEEPSTALPLPPPEPDAVLEPPPPQLVVEPVPAPLCPPECATSAELANIRPVSNAPEVELPPSPSSGTQQYTLLEKLGPPIVHHQQSGTEQLQAAYNELMGMAREDVGPVSAARWASARRDNYARVRQQLPSTPGPLCPVPLRPVPKLAITIEPAIAGAKKPPIKRAKLPTTSTEIVDEKQRQALCATGHTCIIELITVNPRYIWCRHFPCVHRQRAARGPSVVFLN